MSHLWNTLDGILDRQQASSALECGATLILKCVLRHVTYGFRYFFPIVVTSIAWAGRLLITWLHNCENACATFIRPGGRLPAAIQIAKRESHLIGVRGQSFTGSISDMEDLEARTDNYVTFFGVSIGIGVCAASSSSHWMPQN